MVSFENFIKSMPPSLSELKVTPSFCFASKIPDDPTATSKYHTKICIQVPLFTQVRIANNIAHGFHVPIYLVSLAQYTKVMLISLIDTDRGSMSISLYVAL